ncbi:MAG: hydroxyacid dehydrogenase, partial [Pseudomonadota bacterium]
MSHPLRTFAPVPNDVIDQLKAIVGPAGYLDAAADKEPYCRSWRDDYVGDVPLVLRPETTDEVAAIVRLCAATGTAIV